MGKISVNNKNILEVIEECQRKLDKASTQCSVCKKFKRNETFLNCCKPGMIRVIRVCKKCQNKFIIY